MPEYAFLLRSFSFIFLSPLLVCPCVQFCKVLAPPCGVISPPRLVQLFQVVPETLDFMKKSEADFAICCLSAFRRRRTGRFGRTGRRRYAGMSSGHHTYSLSDFSGAVIGSPVP